MYSYTCREPGCRYKYIGESHNNFRTRAKQHLEKYNSKSKAANEDEFHSFYSSTQSFQQAGSDYLNFTSNAENSVKDEKSFPPEHDFPNSNLPKEP